MASSNFIQFAKITLLVLPDILLLASVFLIYRHRQFVAFPVFFIYLCTVALNDAIRVLVGFHFGPGESWPHFYVYWGTDTINIGVSFAVLYEVLRNVLTSGTIKISRSTFLVIVGALLLVSAALAYITSVPRKEPLLMDLILLADGLVRFAQIGVLVMFVAVTIFFGFYWRNQAFGISAGFGIYATMLMVGVYFRRQLGPTWHQSFSLIDVVAYLLATIIWFVYSLKQRQIPLESLPTDKLFDFGEPIDRLRRSRIQS